MDTIEDEAAIFATAMSLSKAAFARRHYAVAYHGLAAAMHAAYDLGDETRLNAVATVAQQQARWVDEHDPDNELSPRAATHRGSTSLWTSLLREVEARRQMVQSHLLLGRPQPHKEA